MVKTVALGNILTETEIKYALKLYEEADRASFAERCAAEVIRPVIDRINEATGQQNDPLYLAYTVEFAFMKSRGNLHA